MTANPFKPCFSVLRARPTRGRLCWLAAVLLSGTLAAPGSAASAPAGEPASAAPATTQATTQATTPANGTGVGPDKADGVSDNQLFCNNIRDAALDAHARWQAAEIQRMEDELRKRAAELESRQKDLQAWLEKREAIVKKAEESVVSIYGRMRADAAAVQIAAMEDDMAISILSKLNPRASSAILNEMEPARAAHLTSSVLGRVPPRSASN